jgi:PII-like signaling protein
MILSVGDDESIAKVLPELSYSALIRRLRREGAAGATSLRGLWGYHGDHRPHAERF